MSFLDLMTELKMMFLFFQKVYFGKIWVVPCRGFLKKEREKHEKEALSSDWVPSELATSEVLIL